MADRLHRILTCNAARALALALACLLVARAAAGDAAPASQPAGTDATSVSFKRDVAPVLLQRCQGCHGPDKVKGEYRLDTLRRLMKAGSSGDAPIVAGKPG